MKAIESHYSYELESVQGDQQLIYFVHEDENGQLVDGTTNEEVLRMLIHRLTQQNCIESCNENLMAIEMLEEALKWLKRREERKKVEKKMEKQLGGLVLLKGSYFELAVAAFFGYQIGKIIKQNEKSNPNPDGDPDHLNGG